MANFADFYKLFPRHSARKDAEKAWMQIGEANQIKALEALPNHVKYWQMSGTEKCYIPLPASWLRGYRWEDEIEMPKPSAKITSAWWTSDDATIAEGNRRGIQPRIGESMSSFRERLKVSA